MSVTSRNPLRMAGANVNSGHVNTGELNMTLGGGITATPFGSGGIVGINPPGASGAFYPVSGSAADCILVSGTNGRLKDVIIHQGLISGQATVFYDIPIAAAGISGGPVFSSGHRLLAIIPASPPGGNSGTFVPAGMYPFDVPFVGALGMRTQSGGPGVTVTYTLETNLPNPG